MRKEDEQPLERESSSEKKVCGNCRYHNTYEYPDYVFCFVKFQNRDSPVITVLDSCDKWENKLQECFCLEDALKKPKKGSS